MNARLRIRTTALLATAALAVLGLTGATSAASAQPDGAGAAAAHPGDAGHGRPCRNGYVGLTFDDGPSATTPQLLAALRANHLRATMFNQGNNALDIPYGNQVFHAVAVRP